MIIKSILDTDLYKLTQELAVIQHFPFAKVRYQFINRGGTQFPEGFAEKLRDEVRKMEELKLTVVEKQWLKEKCYFLSPFYIDFLEGYRFDSSEVNITQNKGNLKVDIEGFWYRVILWEVPLMAIISELYFKGLEPNIHIKRYANNNHKFNLFRNNNIKFADFGTRRRFSKKIHEELITQTVLYSELKEKNFVGTSNVYLAFKYDLTPIGTHAHEWFMFHAAKYGFKMANHMAMENWVETYRGDMGIALSDTFTTDAFLQSFDKKFAKLYDGVRQDSGCPFDFTDKIIEHYKRLGIDPLSKTIVFSDNLNPDLVVGIANYCDNKIKCSFGVGTNLTNDVGHKALNMVIKMTEAKPEGEDWIPVIKLSDSEGKHLGAKETIEQAKLTLNIK